MTRLLIWLGLLVAAVWVLLVGGAWLGIYWPTFRIATMAITIVILAGWAIVAIRNPVWRPRTVMWPAILASLVSLAISTAASRNARVSLEYFGYTLVLVALYLLLVRLFADAFFRARLAAFLSMAFVALVAIYLGISVIHWINWWGAVGRIAVPPL